MSNILAFKTGDELAPEAKSFEKNLSEYMVSSENSDAIEMQMQMQASSGTVNEQQSQNESKLAYSWIPGFEKHFKF